MTNISAPEWKTTSAG